MSKRHISVTIEPSEAGSVLYLPLAAKTDQDQPAAQLSLQFTITNHRTSAVHLNQLKLSFTAPPAVSAVSIPISLDIAPGATVEWNFDTPNNILLPFPTPTSLKLSLSGTGFTSPATFNFPLAAYQTSTLGGSYRFPTQASALLEGEFWQGQSAVHGMGAYGSQLFAYDMGVIGIDPHTMAWSFTLPGTTDDKNEHLRIWGKPVTAVADGFVLEAVNEVPNNPHPLHWTSDADLQQQMTQQMNDYWGSFLNGGAGNHFYIQHGDEVVLYAHMQKGSLNGDLLTQGTPVKTGDFLGLAGNAGNSTGPHLHIHAIKGTKPETGPLRPMPFHDMLAIELGALSDPFPNAPWSLLQGQGLPDVYSAMWPAPGWNTSTHVPFEVAIDPLALLLRNDIYVLLTLPDPAPIEVLERQIAEQVRAMSPGARKQALSRAKAFVAYGTALQRALER